MSMNSEQARDNMIENQIRPGKCSSTDLTFGRLNANSSSGSLSTMAFVDAEVPLGHGEVMMKPVIEGRVLQALAIDPGQRVLEIGTGSGFLAACLAELGADVLSVEQHADLAAMARENLARAGLSRVRIEIADVLTQFATKDTFDCVYCWRVLRGLTVRPGQTGDACSRFR